MAHRRAAPLLKLIAMPNRQSSPARAPRPNFRERYAALEKCRTELLGRLSALDVKAHAHPGYRRALKLLNDTFRKEKLPQRLAVLQAAAWLIAVLEKLFAAA